MNSVNISEIQYDDKSYFQNDISDEVVVIFTWIVYNGLCQFINIFGVVTNIINIICFIRQGFTDSINVSLLGLTISDLGSLITVTWMPIIFNPTFKKEDLPFDPVEVYYITSATPHLTFSRVSSWITAIITLERCLCVIAPLKVKKIVTTKRIFPIIASVFIISFVSVTPTYVVNSLGMKFSPMKNKTLFGLISTNDREGVEQISFAINNFSVPFIAFVFIVICTITLAIKLRDTEKWRNRSTTTQKAGRISVRNQKVARMVLMMSTLFIFCNFPICVSIFVLAFEPALFFSEGFVNIGIITGGFCIMLDNINASVNIFIYYQMSSKFRDTFKRICCIINTRN